MRDHLEAQTVRAKRSRRQWLVAFLLAGSPCLAQEPQNGGIRVLPPLPLNSTAASPAVRTNPFCAPENEPPRAAVRLTTGASQASRSVHLSPIGAAIGLNPIGTEQSITRPAERGPIMTIEPAHESVIQFNPLLQSVHHQNSDLVEANLAPAQPVSHSTSPVAPGTNTPARTTGEASILLVTPAPRPLLVVKPQTATIPVPPISAPLLDSAKPLTSAKPLVKVQVPAKMTTADANLPSVTPEKKAFPLASGAQIPPLPIAPAVVNPAHSSKPTSVAKPKPTKTPDQPAGGASIASMLSKHPQNPVAISKKKDAAPIFFSLSDSTEVAPSKKTLPRSKTINLPSLAPERDQTKQTSVPLTVTVNEDGSIVTAERKKPATVASKKIKLPQPILAGNNTLGTGLGLPAPTSLPEAVSEPKQMPASSGNAKRITPNGKSILSTAGPSSSEDHEKLSVATVKKFKPRTGSADVKAITPAQPFSIIGEKAKLMTEAKPSGKATSIIAQSPSVTKTALPPEPDGGKLTLPTPISIADKVASPESTGKSGRSVIKVENPSPKDSAKSNPHAELAGTDSKTELVNPFNRPQGVRTAAAKERELPETAEMNQAVRVEKFKISKSRPKTRVNLDAVPGPEKNTKQSPIASGVVAPMVLPDSVEQQQATASVATTKPAVEITRAKPSAAPLKTTPNVVVANPASSGAEAKTSVVNKTSMVNKPASTVGEPSGTTILRKRYRPPVAVQAIPGTVTRHSTIASNASPKVQAVPEMIIGDKKTQPPAVDLKQAMRLDTASELKDNGLILGPEVKLTSLHMNQAQVRSLTLGGSVRGVRVGDKGVCQAFASGPNQLKLIGTGIGTTRLVVWAQKDGETDEVLMRAFEIHVDEVVPSEGNSIESTTELLNQSIQKVFPRSQAKVQLVRGELWVTGNCESQDSAEKIIRMVRKSCLIPVRDQLTVK